MSKLIDTMANALTAIMYYIAAAISVITRNKYLMYISVIAFITIVMRPTSFRLGRLFSYNASRY